MSEEELFFINRKLKDGPLVKDHAPEPLHTSHRKTRITLDAKEYNDTLNIYHAMEALCSLVIGVPTYMLTREHISHAIKELKRIQKEAEE